MRSSMNIDCKVVNFLAWYMMFFSSGKDKIGKKKPF